MTPSFLLPQVNLT